MHQINLESVSLSHKVKVWKASAFPYVKINVGEAFNGGCAAWVTVTRDHLSTKLNCSSALIDSTNPEVVEARGFKIGILLEISIKIT